MERNTNSSALLGRNQMVLTYYARSGVNKPPLSRKNNINSNAPALDTINFIRHPQNNAIEIPDTARNNLTNPIERQTNDNIHGSPCHIILSYNIRMTLP
jgi:hypothetical protein